MRWVARAGVEPATFRFSGGRSYQLSYLAVARERATITISIVTGRPEPRTQTSHDRQAVRGMSGVCDPDRTRTGDLRRDRAAR